VRSLLERDEPLALLAGLVDGARAGSGPLVLLAGEAGIGKTSVARAMLDGCGDDVAGWTCGCEPLPVPVPLAPIRQLLVAAGQPDLGSDGADGADRLALMNVCSRPSGPRPQRWSSSRTSTGPTQPRWTSCGCSLVVSTRQASSWS
jgi:hypothetical protein